MNSLIVLLLMLTGTSIHAYPQGVPVSTVPDVCATMTPGHTPATPQTSTPPYIVTFNVPCYTAGVAVNVNVSTLDSSYAFAGFFIEARNPSSNSMSYGTFSNNGDLTMQVLNCFGANANALCHNNTNDAVWTNRTFLWFPPTGYNGDLRFVVTVVLEYSTFWVGIQSTNLSSCRQTVTPTTVSTTPAEAATVQSTTALLLVQLFVLCSLTFRFH